VNKRLLLGFTRGALVVLPKSVRLLLLTSAYRKYKLTRETRVNPSFSSHESFTWKKIDYGVRVVGIEEHTHTQRWKYNAVGVKVEIIQPQQLHLERDKL